MRILAHANISNINHYKKEEFTLCKLVFTYEEIRNRSHLENA